MDYDLIPNATLYKKKQRLRKRWQKIVSMLGCLVVFCTTYALILPAITQERETFCGIEAHSHGDDCYTQSVVKALICSISEEEGHIHTEACYITEGGHAHDEACYQLVEMEGHIHGEGCYTLEGGHAHGSDCYSLTGGHTHGDGCYQWVDACQEAESEEHTHTEACCEQIRNLVCDLTEEPAAEVLTCDLEENPATQVLICELTEEISQEQILICELEEFPGEQILICQQEEAQPHIHEEAC